MCQGHLLPVVLIFFKQPFWGVFVLGLYLRSLALLVGGAAGLWWIPSFIAPGISFCPCVWMDCCQLQWGFWSDAETELSWMQRWWNWGDEGRVGQHRTVMLLTVATGLCPAVAFMNAEFETGEEGNFAIPGCSWWQLFKLADLMAWWLTETFLPPSEDREEA